MWVGSDRDGRWLGRQRGGGCFAPNSEQMAGPGSGRRRAETLRSQLGAAPIPAPDAGRDGRPDRGLRRERLSGPQIARRLGVPCSTVGTILRRLGLGKLARLEPKPPATRYEKAQPGELIHLDIKRLGKIEGVGHHITGYHAVHHRARGVGHEHLHVAIDDASRPAYTEVLPSLGQEDATAFLKRAQAWFGRLGVKAQRVMTDNGSGPPLQALRQRFEGRQRPSCAHLALHAAHRRQRQTLHPDQPARMGLRQILRLFRRTQPRNRPLDRQLQPHSTPHRHRRPHTVASCEQPSWKRQLGRQTTCVLDPWTLFASGLEQEMS